MRRKGKLLGGSSFRNQEDVNPMNYMSNLSDVMLVLAVGIMLALVVAWNVDISTTAPNASANMSQVEQLQDEVLEMDVTNQQSDDAVSVDDFGLMEYGTVYMDEQGNLYVIPSGN